MKRIAFLTVVLGAAAGVGYATHPDESQQYLAFVAQGALRLWDKIEMNPVPVLVAVGTFLLTVIYLHAKGKTLRESVAVAATRVSLVAVPKANEEDENPVVRRAKARATRAQLLTDQIAVQNRHRHLPEAIRTAEREACYTEQAMADTQASLEKKQRLHEDAIAKLESLRSEKAASDAELVAIEVELKKLNELV